MKTLQTNLVTHSFALSRCAWALAVRRPVGDPLRCSFPRQGPCFGAAMLPFNGEQISSTPAVGPWGRSRFVLFQVDLHIP